MPHPHILSVTDPASLPRQIVPPRHKVRCYRAALALGERTRADAYSLRYASYLDSGFIERRPEATFHDGYDALADAQTIVVYEEGRAVASVRVCFLADHDKRSPAHQAFPDEVDRILAETSCGRTSTKAAEITRLVRSPNSANNQGLVFLLYRLAGRLVLARDVQVILSSVRRNHAPFYRRLGFAAVTGERPYPGLNCPMSLLRCARSDYDRVRAGFPIMDPDAVPPGLFDGFERGQPIDMPLIFNS